MTNKTYIWLPTEPSDEAIDLIERIKINADLGDIPFISRETAERFYKELVALHIPVAVDVVKPVIIGGSYD